MHAVDPRTVGHYDKADFVVVKIRLNFGGAKVETYSPLLNIFAGLGVFRLMSSENHLFLYSRLGTCAF